MKHVLKTLQNIGKELFINYVKKIVVEILVLSPKRPLTDHSLVLALCASLNSEGSQFRRISIPKVLKSEGS